MTEQTAPVPFLASLAKAATTVFAHTGYVVTTGPDWILVDVDVTHERFRRIAGLDRRPSVWGIEWRLRDARVVDERHIERRLQWSEGDDPVATVVGEARVLTTAQAEQQQLGQPIIAGGPYFWGEARDGLKQAADVVLGAQTLSVADGVRSMSSSARVGRWIALAGIVVMLAGLVAWAILRHPGWLICVAAGLVIFALGAPSVVTTRIDRVVRRRLERGRPDPQIRAFLQFRELCQGTPYFVIAGLNRLRVLTRLEDPRLVALAATGAEPITWMLELRFDPTGTIGEPGSWIGVDPVAWQRDASGKPVGTRTSRRAFSPSAYLNLPEADRLRAGASQAYTAQELLSLVHPTLWELQQLQLQGSAWRSLRPVLTIVMMFALIVCALLIVLLAMGG